jgi:2-methylcitrate dehydratase PrpD
MMDVAPAMRAMRGKRFMHDDPRLPGADTTLDTLAAFVLGLRHADLDQAALSRAGDVVVDCVTAAVSGAADPGALAARAMAVTAFGKGDHAIWFSGERAPLAAAIFANSTAASILDLDDGHRAAAGHPGAAIVPAVLTAAEIHGSSPQDITLAIVAGYEVAVRIAAARDFTQLDTMSTGRWSHYGVVAALGRLRGLSHDILAQAMAIAGVHGPNHSASGYSLAMGSHTKEGIPWSSLNGALAVDLAVAGFTGPTDILDHPSYFDKAAILADLGRTFAIERVYFKPYSCCRWAHAAIDGLLDIMAREGLSAAEIESVEVRTFSRALRLSNATAPATLPAAQYSIPFTLGVAAHHGREALLPLAESALGDPDAIAFAENVTLAVDPELDAAFPLGVGAHLRVRTAAGIIEQRVLKPLGDPENPMTRDMLLAKFDAATRGLAVQSVRSALQACLDGEPRDLLAALAARSVESKSE